MSLSPEDAIADSVVAAIAAGSWSIGSLKAERIHYPLITAEGYERLRVLVFPADVLSQLATRSGTRTRDVNVAVLAAQQVQRLTVGRQDQIARLGYEIDEAIGGQHAGYTWHGSRRERFLPDWLEAGVYATVVVAQFRRTN